MGFSLLCRLRSARQLYLSLPKSMSGACCLFLSRAERRSQRTPCCCATAATAPATSTVCGRRCKRYPRYGNAVPTPHRENSRVAPLCASLVSYICVTMSCLFPGPQDAWFCWRCETQLQNVQLSAAAAGRCVCLLLQHEEGRQALCGHPNFSGMIQVPYEAATAAIMDALPSFYGRPRILAEHVIGNRTRSFGA
jgi:hypothetical protein